MMFLFQMKFDVLGRTKILFFLKSSYNVPVRNKIKIIWQSKIRKTVMKQKFKC